MNTTAEEVARLQVPTGASTQLRAWWASRAGEHAWNAKCIAISLDGLCNVLDQPRSYPYALLIWQEAVIIFSAIDPATFARLEPRYRAAAVTGICFWWDGSVLEWIEDSEQFLAAVRTLPRPRHRGSRKTSRNPGDHDGCQTVQVGSKSQFASQ